MTPVYDRVFNFSCPNNQGPLVQTGELLLPEVGDFQLEAWISNFGASNVHIFAGSLSLADAQQRLATTGGSVVDMLMTLPSSGPGCVLVPDGTGQITVLFEADNTAGQTQMVTVRVRELRS